MDLRLGAAQVMLKPPVLLPVGLPAKKCISTHINCLCSQQPWAVILGKLFLSLCLSFLIYKMGISLSL